MAHIERVLSDRACFLRLLLIPFLSLRERGRGLLLEPYIARRVHVPDVLGGALSGRRLVL